MASITGRLLLRWDGSRISWWNVEPPTNDPEAARLELARRFLRSLGPSTPSGFAWWAGVPPSDAKGTFESLKGELAEFDVEGDKLSAMADDSGSLNKAQTIQKVRLLPPGDPYLGGSDRDILVPTAALRANLWPRSVWPGALFVEGELAGTWRRQQGRFVVFPWAKLNSQIKEAVEVEVETMPIESRKEVIFRNRGGEKGVD
jgi:hypothetical protein